MQSSRLARGRPVLLDAIENLEHDTTVDNEHVRREACSALILLLQEIPYSMALLVQCHYASQYRHHVPYA